MSTDILIANRVSKSYGGVKALDDVSMTIKSGEIHCLVGENGSGKSTFVKIISGAITPDHAEIILNGNHYNYLTPITAIHEGIQVIYQDLSLFPHMSAAENIAMNKMVASGKRFVNNREVFSIAEKQLAWIGESIDLRKPVEELSMANRQLVAICRALSQNAKLLFMDEPTTALPKTEVDRLLKIVMDLKSIGLSIVFISHKLNEVFEVADTISIFRDGRKVGDFFGKDLDHDSLVYHMTGRSVKYPRYIKSYKDDPKLLEVQGLSRKGHYEDINFSLHPGDILGVTGLHGSGRDELALSLFGLNPPDSGKILLRGVPQNIKSPVNAITNGLGLVPEDRLSHALFSTHSVGDNITAASLSSLTNKLGLVDKKSHDTSSSALVKKLRIRTPNLDLLVQNLSGGNQQKTVIARWALTQPKVLILNGPTVGVDIGSKADIYEKIQAFANQGMAIILISDDMPELLANCNQVMVMRNHKIAGVFKNADLEKPNAASRIQTLLSSGSLDDEEETAEEEVLA